ncbi:uncharacterized protein LOC143493145 [Brachyhypopomus gauderio]|uniref:uncharacterized protein LOC143493145 n=1 Tax=Brachyhypopomus gauderio TaxID=698409 RepID=UPI004042A638
MAVRGQRAFRPAEDHCHLCLLQGSALSPGHAMAPCPVPEPGPGPLPWRGPLPLPFPLELGMAEDRMGDRDRHVPRRRQVYLGPSRRPASESCGAPWYSWREVGVSPWDWPPGPGLSPCTCVWERPRECECVRPWYPIEQPHPFNGGHVPQLLPAKVRGRRYYREARYVAMEHYWDYYAGTHLQGPEWDNLGPRGFNGHYERRHVTFESQNDGSECDSAETSRPASPTSPTRTHYNGPLAFFPTEVPQSQYRSGRTPRTRLAAAATQGGDPTRGCAVGAGGAENPRIQKKIQGSVREQIKQVVTELEDVLGGLKQVQLEMKEVVEKIDLLTSNIDLGESEDQDPGLYGNCFGVVALIHDSEGETECLQQGGVRQGGLRTTSSPSPSFVSSCVPVHGPDAVVEFAERKRVNHMLTADVQRAKILANGDCLLARPPRAKVKEVWHRRTGVDRVALSKTPEQLFPLVGSAKTQRPLQYPQNGQVKTPLQEPNCSPDILKMPRYPRKKKQFPSTVV